MGAITTRLGRRWSKFGAKFVINLHLFLLQSLSTFPHTHMYTRNDEVVRRWRVGYKCIGLRSISEENYNFAFVMWFILTKGYCARSDSHVRRDWLCPLLPYVVIHVCLSLLQYYCSSTVDCWLFVCARFRIESILLLPFSQPAGSVCRFSHIVPPLLSLFPFHIPSSIAAAAAALLLCVSIWHLSLLPLLPPLSYSLPVDQPTTPRRMKMEEKKKTKKKWSPSRCRRMSAGSSPVSQSATTASTFSPQSSALLALPSMRNALIRKCKRAPRL